MNRVSGGDELTRHTRNNNLSRKTRNIAILRSDQNPKKPWIDDAEVVCDRIAELGPSFGNFLAQEGQNGVGELAIVSPGSVVGEMLVHDAPQPLDRVQMRAVVGDEVQADSSAGLREPLLNENGVVIARIVKEDVDQDPRRVSAFDCFQELDRRGRIDGFHLDHRGLAGFEVRARHEC